ncbi:expressed unknown protein [Seminavis robusta]|uniref:Uncharacterized protein n=1 Tax=Seminavis robusta TaxID=568900 RepID=A0A9N8DZG7_9STRA|nr:expressed unknown protein [Seminavis robusta]|eukprot:Sro500_g155360.1 n/a (197) ;mRNA; r:58283-58873
MTKASSPTTKKKEKTAAKGGKTTAKDSAAKKSKATSKNELLGVIAQLGLMHDGKPPRDLVARRAGYGSGDNPSFKKALLRASKRDHVDLSDKLVVSLTEKGQQEAGDPPELPTNKAAQEKILEELTAKMKTAFELMRDGKVHLRTDLAEKLGYDSAKEQGFKKLLDRIRLKGYLEAVDKDSVQLSDLCFPNGRHAE